MMYVRRSQHAELCVLRVSPNVLDLSGVVVTDANAAAEGLHVRFAPAPHGLRIVDRELTFAENWTSPDQIEYFQRKSKKSAEVLVPDSVPPRFLIGAYVSCDEALARFNALGVKLQAAANRHIFFR